MSWTSTARLCSSSSAAFLNDSVMTSHCSPNAATSYVLAINSPCNFCTFSLFEAASSSSSRMRFPLVFGLRAPSSRKKYSVLLPLDRILLSNAMRSEERAIQFFLHLLQTRFFLFTFFSRDIAFLLTFFDSLLKFFFLPFDHRIV